MGKKKQENEAMIVHNPELITEYALLVRGNDNTIGQSPISDVALAMREKHKLDELFIEHANIIDCLWRISQLDGDCSIYIVEGVYGSVCMDKKRALDSVANIIRGEYERKVKITYHKVIRILLDAGEIEAALEVFNDNLRDDLGGQSGKIRFAHQQLLI